VRWVMHLIPTERPTISMTADGPAVAHSSDFTLISCPNRRLLEVNLRVSFRHVARISNHSERRSLDRRTGSANRYPVNARHTDVSVRNSLNGSLFTRTNALAIPAIGAFVVFSVWSPFGVDRIPPFIGNLKASDSWNFYLLRWNSFAIRTHGYSSPDF